MKHVVLFLFAAGFFAAGGYLLYHSHTTRHAHELIVVLLLFGTSVALAIPARAKHAFGAIVDAYRGAKSSGGAL